MTLADAHLAVCNRRRSAGGNRHMPLTLLWEHDLDRGGDRAANNAFWTTAMVRMRGDRRTVTRCGSAQRRRHDHEGRSAMLERLYRLRTLSADPRVALVALQADTSAAEITTGLGRKAFVAVRVSLAKSKLFNSAGRLVKEVVLQWLDTGWRGNSTRRSRCGARIGQYAGEGQECSGRDIAITPFLLQLSTAGVSR